MLDIMVSRDLSAINESMLTSGFNRKSVSHNSTKFYYICMCYVRLCINNTLYVYSIITAIIASSRTSDCLKNIIIGIQTYV